MMKTSASHPLRIDAVSPGEQRGEIGLTFCPGKYMLHGFTGSWDRDLDADLDVIETWGAKAIVTLMEGDELERVRVPLKALEAGCAKRGIELHHLPIVDGQAPDERLLELWGYAGPRLHRHIDDGERIVIHCRGGLGRTGTVAAMLLIERGIDVAAAVDLVRSARPGAIETRAQERYVEAWAPKRDTPVAHDRHMACLLGGAIGDAFGYAVEFKSLAEIHRSHGPDGLAEPVWNRGKLVVSDDTQMTLFTLDGLLRAKLGATPREEVLGAVNDAYRDWYWTQRPDRTGRMRGSLARHDVLRVSRAPGNTCLSALSAGGGGAPEAPLNDSRGCGGVMRVAPVGFWHWLDDEALFEIGVRTAALTHGHPSGYLPAGYLAVIVAAGLRGTAIGDAMAAAGALLIARRGQEETLELVTRAGSLAADRAVPHIEAVAALGEGWVGDEALAIGLYAALAARNFREAIRIAANHDGDSDSTASIAGQIWGAFHGLAGMPTAWVYGLDVLGPLLHLAGQLETRRSRVEASIEHAGHGRHDTPSNGATMLSTETPELTGLTTTDLLRLYRVLLDELRHRGITRSYNNPVADLAERIVALALGATLAGRSNAGHDLVGADGTRFEVKARRLTAANPSRQMGVIRNIDRRLFDKLVCVLFDEDFNVIRGCVVPHEAIKDLARFGNSINGYLLHAEDDLLARGDVVDVTAELHEALSQLDERNATR